MAAPSNVYAFNLEVATKAGDLWKASSSERDDKLRAVDEGRYNDADSSDRLVKHANRLLDKVRAATKTGREGLSPELVDMLDRGTLTSVDNVTYERIIGETRDFLSVEFLDLGFRMVRAVGRVVTELGDGRQAFGTGFMVSPRLMMTNHHVLGTNEEAAHSTIEFDYQLDREGNPLRIGRFRLEPERFFLNDKGLDYALVAVAPSSVNGMPLDAYGWCPIYKEEGKITLNGCVNIIQHPRGEMKQVVIRENKLVAIKDNLLQYEGDTEVGSSGSPAFNDLWEVVALHHSGVPRMDDQNRILNKSGGIWDKVEPESIDWVANEGVRASRLVAHIAAAAIQPHEVEIRAEFLAATPPIEPPVVTGVPAVESEPDKEERTVPATQPISTPLRNNPNGATITVPLTITISVEGQGASHAVHLGAQQTGAPPHLEVAQEKAVSGPQPDPDYTDRPGYDVQFLGFKTPLPALTDVTAADAFELKPGKYEIPYYHYSVIFNANRRIAAVSAVNVDMQAKQQFQRAGADKWFFDPRVPKEIQAGNEFYSNNPLDRGHLTRRADAAWGNTKKESQLGNDDTFHFTNCSPQHEVFNQSSKATAQGLMLWGNIENYIASESKSEGKLNVFNGPVFREDDRTHRGLQIPREFWKVVIYIRDDGKPGAAAFILSQTDLISDLPDEEFTPGDFKPAQVTISQLGAKVGLDFSAITSWDAKKSHGKAAAKKTGTVGEESLSTGTLGRKPVSRLSDIEL